MGIGSAIFVDGHLYTGRNGLAGELGHTTVEKDGKLCSCGNRGCLELYSSAAAIIGRVRTELEQGVNSALTNEFGGNLDKLSVEKIAAAADSHDRLSERVLSEAGAWLGTALAGVVNLLNPERIILAGKVPRSEEGIFLASLLYNLRDRAYPQATKDLSVVVSQLGEEAAAVGAVLIAGEEVLKARCREMEERLSSAKAVTVAQTGSSSGHGVAR
jgi:predicted NBD/HSP70 family sugar kinase